MEAVFALGPLVLFMVGVGLLWTQALIRSNQTLASLLHVFGWSAMMLATILIVLIYSMFIIAPVLIVVVVLAWLRYSHFERQAMLSYLTTAAERGIPLAEAVRAFASDRIDHLGSRANRLADYLEAGVPLSLALRRSQIALPPAAMLAADMGQQTGSLGAGLRQVEGQIDAFEGSLRSLIETIFYLVFLVGFGGSVLTFLMLKIVPVFAKMFDEFELELPPATQLLIFFSDLFLTYSFIPLSLFVMVGLTVVTLQLLGHPVRQLPIICRLWWRADCALVMRWLADSVRQERSISETLRQLASYFPQPTLSRRLERAAQRVDRGIEWTDALYAVGIIRKSERNVFESAERAGNLSWALEEMADSSMRRSALRLRAFANVAFPLIIILAGMAVLFFAVGMLIPLFALIQGLS